VGLVTPPSWRSKGAGCGVGSAYSIPGRHAAASFVPRGATPLTWGAFRMHSSAFGEKVTTKPCSPRGHGRCRRKTPGGQSPGTPLPARIPLPGPTVAVDRRLYARFIERLSLSFPHEARRHPPLLRHCWSVFSRCLDCDAAAGRSRPEPNLARCSLQGTPLAAWAWPVWLPVPNVGTVGPPAHPGFRRLLEVHQDMEWLHCWSVMAGGS